jgi:hypothetical protein
MDTLSIPASAPVVVGPQNPNQYSDTETYSKNILGPVWFTMKNLRVAGTAGDPVPPVHVAPKQSPYIIASDEVFSLSVDIEFNHSPLSSLLMCLGTVMNIDFAFEGLGAKANELDLAVSDVTQKDKYTYTLTYTSTPRNAGMDAGLYKIAAVATIGPANHPCSQFVLGYGYITEVLLQVYQ